MPVYGILWRKEKNGVGYNGCLHGIWSGLEDKLIWCFKLAAHMVKHGMHEFVDYVDRPATRLAESYHFLVYQQLLGAERVLQRLRGVRGQDDATETGRRATPQRIVDIVRNRTLK